MLKQILPFRYEWFDELSTEVVTFTFYALTAYKFQPASNNPYLQVSQNGNDYEEEAENLIRMQKQDGDNDGTEEYIDGNVESVLDMIDHNYYNQTQISPNKNNNNNNSALFKDLSYRRQLISSTQI